MTDTLDYLIETEAQRRTHLALRLSPLTYALWIDGKGWLRNSAGRVLADQHSEVIETAAALWGRGARVMVVDTPMEHESDSALTSLQSAILAHQAETQSRRWRVRLAARFARLARMSADMVRRAQAAFVERMATWAKK